ncbi:glutamate synthase [NADH], amyloplastic-like [Selaginella moellendorffii]|uniref:glutamate synthase [NADH], amyloplastic-like n=1 Tax=Selaginella moellendorffii TaxID=88036 RepID=UPI000D1C4C11|nr:glutamate synthase [NADH], amyloplastic-like [Selaginella moellendorffii]|eukprot:XP_024525693.1 glutamate synthase [NADH], amyloplastic-like [Selaginella moellendorffii]
MESLACAENNQLNWEANYEFVKVFPLDYKRALNEEKDKKRAAEEEEARLAAVDAFQEMKKMAEAATNGGAAAVVATQAQARPTRIPDAVKHRDLSRMNEKHFHITRPIGTRSLR